VKSKRKTASIAALLVLACFASAILISAGTGLRVASDKVGRHSLNDLRSETSSSHVPNPYDFSRRARILMQIHAHTDKSDGVDSTEGLITKYANLGYRCLAITDHNQVNWPWPINPTNMVPIKGNEISTSDGYHIGSLFSNYAPSPDTRTAQQCIDEINSRQGIAIVNHPFYLGKTGADLLQLTGYSGLEIYNRNKELGSNKGYSLALWDSVLTGSDQSVWGFAADDYHGAVQGQDRGKIIVVADDDSELEIKEALKRGSFYAIAGGDSLSFEDIVTDDRGITVETSAPATIRFVGKNGSVLRSWSNRESATYDVAGDEDFVRVEAAAGDTELYSNPIEPIDAPRINSITPSYGTAGAKVTVRGSGFGSEQGNSYLSFGSTRVTKCLSWSDESIQCEAPEGGSGTVRVTVTTFVETSSSKASTFTYTYPTWYLAEGSTAWGFSTYITIENPNTNSVDAQITYQTTKGPVSGRTVNLPALSQASVNPQEVLGEQDFSTKVVCKEGKTIAVDRTMVWTGAGAPSEEGHSSVGVTAPTSKWYLPEGSSAWGFECWLLIQNPNSREASCDVTYMIEGEGPKTVNHKVPAGSRATFNMGGDIGAKDASVMVSSNMPIIPERAMYRNNRREGHDSIGTTSPASDFYLAEGSTAWGFTTYVLVQNPNKTPTNVTITYMTPSGAKPQPAFTMSPNSRKTIRVNDVTQVSNTDLSTKVHSSQPIIAERAMYWGADTPLGEACHDSIGMNEPHTTFYLPDGQTTSGRETYTLVQNPNSTDLEVEISYLTSTGEDNTVFTDTIPADSRKTYNMADKGINGRAAIMVTSKNSGKKIMCERAMYWKSRGAGTDTIGGYSD